ncbi:MAG TPA: tetratricopeptide repeat protein [Pyrinomonadaceae bacterium]
MKKTIYYLCLSLLLMIFCVPNSFSKSGLVLNRIEGLVFDPNRNPVNDVRVELLDEVGSQISNTQTRAGGRFSFIGVTPGRFLLRVIPMGKNFLEETKEVEVYSSRRGSSDTAYVDIYLRYDKRAATENLQDRHPETIFVQDIPPDAKKLYESSIESLKKNQDKGISELEEAVRIFPTYFDALNSLGREYVSRKDYKKAYPYLLRAIDVNQRSVSAFYSLAYAFYQLNEVPAALEASKAVTTLAPNYADAQLLHGIVLRMNGSYKDAETTLLKAKSLAKKPNPEIHWQLALVYNKLNRNKEATQELETYLKVSPNSPDKKKVEDLIGKLKNSK